MSVVLSQFRWPSLARDLAIMTVPGSPLTELSTVYAKFEITAQDLQEILLIPSFQKLFAQELDNFRAQGPAAGPKFRFSVLSQSLADKLYGDASEGKMDPKDSIKLLEHLLKAAGLYDVKEVAVNTQVNVGVSLPLPQSLRGTTLKHAFPAEQEAIDVAVR